MQSMKPTLRTQTRHLIAFALFALGYCVLLSTGAQAVSLTIGSMVDNTAVTLTGGSGVGERGEGRQLFITNPGQTTPDILGATVSAATRFTATVAANRGGGFAVSGNPAIAQDNVNYSINFSVVPDSALSTYDLSISTSILGMAGNVDDHSGVGQYGTASMSAVSGWLNAVPYGSLGLASAVVSAVNAGTTPVGTQFSANNMLALGSFSGAQNFTLNFTWIMHADSPKAVNGGDATAVRIGFNNALAGAVGIDDYPGAPARTQANDGHFVNILTTMTYVPEPSALAFAVLGGISLVASRLHRSRRSR